MTGSKVLVALRVAATPREAFDVFTGEISSWWQPNPLFRFTPRSPGTVRFEGQTGGRFVEELPNGKVFEIGRIRVWEPGSRLVFGWRTASFSREQDTEVDVRFEPVGQETRVTIEHRGWDSVPVQHVARHGFANAVFLKREGEWWHVLLARLEAEIAGKARAP